LGREGAVGILAAMVAIPSIPFQDREVFYEPVTSTTDFAVDFPIFGDASDIEVLVDDEVQATGWSLTSPSGALADLARPITDGVVEFDTGQSGVVITIRGKRQPRRTSQNTEGVPVTARQFNQFASDLIASQQEVVRDLSRATDVLEEIGDLSSRLDDLELATDVAPNATATYGSRAAAAAANVPVSRTAMVVLGYSALFDSPPAHYKEVSDVGTLYAWQFRTNGNTRRWQLVEREPWVQHFGADITGATNARPSVNNGLAYLVAVWGGGILRADGCVLGVSGGPITINANNLLLAGSAGHTCAVRRLADDGPLVLVADDDVLTGSVDSTRIARAGVQYVNIQDLTGIGTHANSPFAIIYKNVTDAKHSDLQCYNECMQWQGVIQTWTQKFESFWVPSIKPYASGRAAVHIGALKNNLGVSVYPSAGIWQGVSWNLEVGSLDRDGGGALTGGVTSACDHGLLLDETDGIELVFHVQGYAVSGYRLTDTASRVFGLYNVEIEPFSDIGNGHGGEIIGDRAMQNISIKNGIVSHTRFGDLAAYGLLLTNPGTQFSLHFKRIQSTARDGILIQNAAARGHLKVDYMNDCGHEAADTYNAISIVAGQDWEVEAGTIRGNAVTKAGVAFIGASSIGNKVTGGRVRDCVYGLDFSNSVDCMAVGTDVTDNDFPGVYTAATNPIARSCRGQTDFGTL
jgi:hypothetical protein